MTEDPGELETFREAFSSLAVTAQPTPQCPEPEKLWEGVRGELAPDVLRDVVDHMASCPVCAEAWRLAIEVADEVPRAPGLIKEPAVVRPAQAVVSPWWRYAAAAAAVVVATVVLPRLLERPQPTEPPQFREVTQGEAIASLVSEDALLERGSCTLSWRFEPAEEGVRFSVRVMTEDLRPLAEAYDLEEASFQVPEAQLTALASGSRLLWQVEAVLPDGSRTSSKTFAAQLQ